MSPRSLNVNVDLNTRPATESFIGNLDFLASNVTPTETKINTYQTNGKKSRKRPRKRTQLKQRSAISESSHCEEQIDDISEDEDEDEDEDENTKIY
jgi:hypothetical protein